MDSFFERLSAIPDKITYQSNHVARKQVESPLVAEPLVAEIMAEPQHAAGLRSNKKRTRKSRFGGIPNGAVVAYKQNNNSAPVLVNTATAKRLMVNKTDPMYHGGRKRRGTRKN